MASLQGGSFLSNLLRGFAILLAQATLLCAFTLDGGDDLQSRRGAARGAWHSISAGNALWALRETLLYGEPGQFAQRMVHLGLQLLPDFDRIGVAAQLAAGHAVNWNVVSSAWLYDGVYALTLHRPGLVCPGVRREL